MYYLDRMATATNSTPSPAREAQELFFQIAMEHRAWLVHQLAQLDLTLPQMHVLRLLEPGAAVPMSDLAERIVCDASNITGIADRLQARGLVERRPGESDRRVRALALTPTGVELRERVLEIMTEPPAAIAALPPSDQRALRDIYRRALDLQLRAASGSGDGVDSARPPVEQA
jgi:DNA-binding MarR family transcriptional regulator